MPESIMGSASDEELEQWFADNIMTLKVLKEQDTDKFKKVHAGLVREAELLYRTHRIKEELLIFLQNEKNFEF